MEDLTRRVRTWQDRLNEASGRFGGVEICAVTKTVAPERVNEAYEAGVRVIGENRVQELMGKIDRLHPGFSIHLIGQLQTNKVGKILGRIHMLQSLDRESLAEAVDKRAQALGIEVPALIQVNIAREPQKAGIAEEELESFVRRTASRPGIRVEGLMAIMPLVDDPETVRPYFRKMRQWFDRLGEMEIEGATMRCLSMGMSGDCVVAAEEGATMVRLGRALFGARN